MKVCVVGLGYIGLPTAIAASLGGCEVVGVDIYAKVIDTLSQGIPHIHENGLQEKLTEAIGKGFRVSLTVESSDVYVITVPTPINEDKTPDMSYVASALRSIKPVVKSGQLVIIESTSPVGTTKWAKTIVTEEGVLWAYCPERVLPGRTFEELASNSRVIGANTHPAYLKAAEFYGSFVNAELERATEETAEMVKLTENAFRDVNIAFANELSMICPDLKVNVFELIRLANLHPRVNILNPGAGVGGHCISVDPWFIVSQNPKAKLMKQARLTNDEKPLFLAEQLSKLADARQETRIVCLGLAFKPNIDDMRESPSVTIVERLAVKYEVFVVEPFITELPQKLKPIVKLISLKEAKEFTLAAVLTQHSVFDGFHCKGIVFNTGS